jgi:hypothetical protein
MLLLLEDQTRRRQGLNRAPTMPKWVTPADMLRCKVFRHSFGSFVPPSREGLRAQRLKQSVQDLLDCVIRGHPDVLLRGRATGTYQSVRFRRPRPGNPRLVYHSRLAYHGGCRAGGRGECRSDRQCRGIARSAKHDDYHCDTSVVRRNIFAQVRPECGAVTGRPY